MSPQSNLNKSNAPRDHATLCRAGRFMLRTLATELGMLQDPATAAAFQGLPTEEQARQVKEALDAFDRANGGAPQQQAPQQAPPQQQPPQGFQAPPQGQQFTQPPQGYQQPPQQQFAPPPQMQQNFMPPVQQQQQSMMPTPQGMGFVPPQQVPPNGLAAQGGFQPPMQQGFPQQQPQGFPQQPPPQQQPMFTAPQDQPAQPPAGKATRKPRTTKGAAAATPEANGHAPAAAQATGGSPDTQRVLDGQRDILDELENMRKKNEVLTALVYIIIENSFEGDLNFFLNRVNEINPSVQDGITRLLGKAPTKS